jgi:hypothetical protein
MEFLSDIVLRRIIRQTNTGEGWVGDSPKRFSRGVGRQVINTQGGSARVRARGYV